MSTVEVAQTRCSAETAVRYLDFTEGGRCWSTTRTGSQTSTTSNSCATSPPLQCQSHAVAESYRQRLEQEAGLNFIEFNYMLLQAYDSGTSTNTTAA